MSEENDNQDDVPKGISPEDFNALKDQVSAISQGVANSSTAMAQVLEQLQSRGGSASQEDVEDAVDSAGGGVDFSQMTDAQIEAHFTERIGKKLEKTFEDKLSSTLSAKEKRENALHNVSTQYPELRQSGSELQTKMQEVYAGLDKNFRDTPQGIEYAAMKAAQELNIQPASKRTGNDDSFVLDGSRTGRTKTQAKPKIKENQIALMELLGMDPNDKAAQERIAKNSQRNWLKYQ